MKKDAVYWKFCALVLPRSGSLWSNEVGAMTFGSKRVYVGAMLVALFTQMMACTPAIGDTCETNIECDTGAGEICDVSVAEGYCTLASCVPNGCPDDSVCIQFDENESYCMFFCETDSDCRANHVCRKDKGKEGFCYVPAP